ncbi:ABCC5 [Bugula neritina]|uniref:ABCC5 n=1 Tax=Bugula neritina TaxID=10212 RepID=A0A7J7JVI5_BUGNE|nr:ABCC5 [Bugula neritina]
MLATQSYTPTEEDRSYKGWKHLIPFRKRSKNPKTLPLTSAGPLSYVTGFWLSGLIFHSNKSNLTKTDLYNTPWRDSAACNLERFEKIWDEEVSKHGKANCSVVRAVCKLIRSRLIISAILIVLLSACAVVGPAYFLQTLLKLNADPDASTGIKILYIVALAIWTNFSTQVQLVTFTTTNVAAVRVRGGVFSAVFKKILYQKIQSKSAGELINLCAADGQRLYWAVMNGIFVFGSMMGAILGGTYSVYLLGPWGASGFVLVLVALPLPQPGVCR